MFDISLLDVPLDAPALSNPKKPELVCICCNCDRIRTRSGKWIEGHTPAAGERHTHGICPDCFVILYPEFANSSGR